MMRFAAIRARFLAPIAASAIPLGLVFAACIPSGNAPPYDGGAQPAASTSTAPPARRAALASPPLNGVFEDTFDRSAPVATASAASGAASGAPPGPVLSPLRDAGKEGGTADAGAAVAAVASVTPPGPTMPRGDTSDLGPDWIVVGGATNNSWRIEGGKLCGRNAKNRGVWLNRTLPTNARIEFDAMSDSPEGDLKAEVWGDGQTGANAISYTNATSYLVIYGGWKNTIHALARLNEHGNDRKTIDVKPSTDEFRERAVAQGQVYRFKVERSDGKTVRWWVNDTEMLSFEDAAPLVGATHDHFGFNNWQVRVCFDNVKVSPLSAM